MAPSGTSSATFALGALGTVAMLSAPAVQQAFLAPSVSGPSSSSALRGAVAGSGAALPEASSANNAAVYTALGTAAVAAAAMASGRRASTRRTVNVQQLASATGNVATKPFAGGLIGGESGLSSGDFNFDPLGLSVKCEKYLPYFREAELKHGRIAMLAWIGLVAPEFVRLPGPAFCFGAKNVVEAHNACAVHDLETFFTGTADFIGTQHEVGPLFQMFYVCGFIEMLTSFAKFCNISNKAAGLSLENAGDYKLGVQFLPKDEQKIKEMKLKELKNGRLAMLAFGGAVTQATLSGNGFPWLYATGKKCQGAGLSSSCKLPASSSSTFSRGGQVARKASLAEESGYTMSKAVPFLPMSPALEGLAGEEEGFDPLGMSLAIDIRWLREAELKHARVAMLATAGWIATDLGMRVPGEPFREISTVQAHDAMVAFGSMSHMLIWFGIAEGFGMLAITNMLEGKTDRQPGDFGLRTLYPSDATGQREMQLKELRNGRLAMLAYGGIATMAVLTEGEKWPFFATKEDKKTSGGSTLCGGVSTTARHIGRAASATACQATPAAAAAAPAAPTKRAFSKSMPFLPKPANLEGLAGNEAEFDPLELSTTWDVRWMQEAELKHGRVCMLAVLGFVTEPMLTFPGMTSAPDATQAVYTAPIPAMAALLFIAGSIESNAYNGKINMLDMFEGEGAKRQPGDLNFGKQFLPKDKAAEMDIRTKELANGRLAMLAIGGMIHHNIVVNGPLFPLIPDGWTGPASIIGNTPFAGGH